MALPSKVSESVRRLNPHLFGGGVSVSSTSNEAAKTDTPRMRQNRGPKMNKTEAAFFEHLRATFANSQIEREGVTLRIANGSTYTPDFSDFGIDGRLTLWEVKGAHAWDDAIVKLKVAAYQYDRVTFYLASPRKDVPGLWRIELVHP